MEAPAPQDYRPAVLGAIGGVLSAAIIWVLGLWLLFKEDSSYRCTVPLFSIGGICGATISNAFGQGKNKIYAVMVGLTTGMILALGVVLLTTICYTLFSFWI